MKFKQAFISNKLNEIVCNSVEFITTASELADPSFKRVKPIAIEMLIKHFEEPYLNPAKAIIHNKLLAIIMSFKPVEDNVAIFQNFTDTPERLLVKLERVRLALNNFSALLDNVNESVRKDYLDSHHNDLMLDRTPLEKLDRNMSFVIWNLAAVSAINEIV